MNNAHIASLIVTACWAAWVLYWIVSWRKEKPVTERQSSHQTAAYSVLLMLSFIFAVAGAKHLPLLSINLVPYSSAVAAIGTGLCVAGVAVTIWSRRILADNWSVDVTFKQGQELVSSGPYALVRHPIYTGLTTLFIGTALALGTLGVLLAILFAFASFIIKLNQEERLMMAHFGSKYAAYRKRTKKIIPFIY